MNEHVTPLLQPTPPAGEEQRVAEVLHGVEAHIGFVLDGLRLCGISPEMLEGFVGAVTEHWATEVIAFRVPGAKDE